MSPVTTPGIRPGLEEDAGQRGGSEKYLLTLNSIQCINNSYHLFLYHWRALLFFFFFFKKQTFLHYNLQRKPGRKSNTRPPRSISASQQPYQEDGHESGLGVRRSLLLRLVLPSVNAGKEDATQLASEA